MPARRYHQHNRPSVQPPRPQQYVLSHHQCYNPPRRNFGKRGDFVVAERCACNQRVAGGYYSDAVIAPSRPGHELQPACLKCTPQPRSGIRSSRWGCSPPSSQLLKEAHPPRPRLQEAIYDGTVEAAPADDPGRIGGCSAAEGLPSAYYYDALRRHH